VQHDRVVPVVDFYGEAQQWSTSDLVHSEPLVERSSLHDWKIRPHRHDNLMQLFLLQKGGGTATLDATCFEVAPPCVLIVPKMCVHDFEWHKNSSGFALSIASPLISELSRQFGSGGAVFQNPAILDLATDFGYVETLFTAIHHENHQELTMKSLLLDSMVRALTVWLFRRASQHSTVVAHPSRASRHYRRFAELVDEQHKSHRSVVSYANEMGITPSHLNAICQKLASVSALTVIQQRLILSARRNLVYTEKTIAGVAFSLGFSDPSYFTRFFKRCTGMTPIAYRRRSGTFAGGE